MAGEDNPAGPLRARDCALPLSDEMCSRLVSMHGPMVKAACQRIVHDSGAAEDLVQETFLLLLRKLPTLPPGTILGGWLYMAACNIARSHQRQLARRIQRENHLSFMNGDQDALWQEVEPLLDVAMLSLSSRQRELVLLRYFQSHSQRAAAAVVGCSESVASRELASAVERLRTFFARRGVSISGPALTSLLLCHGAQATVEAGTFTASLLSATLTTGATGGSLLLTIMKTTTTTKIIGGAIALLLVGTTVHYTNRHQNAEPGASESIAPSNSSANPAVQARVPVPAPAGPSVRPATASRSLASPGNPIKPGVEYDEAALLAAREKPRKFLERINQFALMNDAEKVQRLLATEFGINLSVETIRALQARGPKGFGFGILEQWAGNQPQEALAWAAGILPERSLGGGDLQQTLLDAARRAMPGLDRASLDAMLPEGPGRSRMLDLLEGSTGTDPAGMAREILAETDPNRRSERLRTLAQASTNPEESAEWARQNLSGTDKTSFYSQIAYNLAHQNPQSALRVLDELKGTDEWVSSFGAMMRGLVQMGGLGQQAAELVANANLQPEQRTQLISELSRRWVRNDPDAAIEWANNLSVSEDFRAAIPLLVSQLDNGRIRGTVESFLESPDPTMELALIEAAAPPGLGFDPEKSRMIIDPLLSHDPSLRLTASEGAPSSKGELMWSSVDQTARRQVEAGQPAAAMDWLAQLPFASPSDYNKAVANVFNVWNIKSETEAAAWLQNSTLDPALRAQLAATPKP